MPLKFNFVTGKLLPLFLSNSASTVLFFLSLKNVQVLKAVGNPFFVNKQHIYTREPHGDCVIKKNVDSFTRNYCSFFLA